MLRSYSTESLTSLRSKLGSSTPAIVFDMFGESAELDNEESIHVQRRRLLEACKRLVESGASVELSYWVTSPAEREVVSIKMARNLIASDLEYLKQEHD